MAALIDIITQSRKASKNTFDEFFFRIIVNMAWGKTMVSKQNWKKLSTARDKIYLMQNFRRNSIKIFK